MNVAFFGATRSTIKNIAILCSTVGAVLVNSLVASALTEEQLLQKLEPVPMFVIGDEDDGIAFSRVSRGDTVVNVIGVFVSPTDAAAFLDRVQAESEEPADDLQVRTVSLADVYTYLQESRESEDNPIVQFVPKSAEVDVAVSLLQGEGEDISREEFFGVPVFLGQTAAGQPIGVMAEDSDQEVFPVFFDSTAANNLVEAAEAQNAELEGSIKIEVGNLESVITLLEQSSGEEPSSRLELIPSAESIQYLRSLQNSSGSSPDGN